MKVSCPSCDSKYTIADDKVIGKKIKVRCKTCSTQILVDGTINQGEEPSAGTEAISGSDSGTSPESISPVSPSMESNESDVWTVNLSETEERSMTTSELVDAALGNQLGPDVFVWKDGMGDWLLVTDVPELRDAINAKKGSPAAGKTPAASKVGPKTAATNTAGTKASESVAPAASDSTEKRGPIVAAPGSALAKKMASAKAASLAPKAEPAPDKPKETKASKEAKLVPEKKAATRLSGKRTNSTHDLFAGVDQAGSEIDVDTSDVPEADHAKATGARNENSVLFSLDALKSGIVAGGAPTGKGGPSPMAPAGRKAPAAPSKRLEDLMTLDGPGPLGPMGGGGGLLLSGNDALLTAPAPPPPKPEPKPAPAPVASAAAGVQSTIPKPKSKLALIVGIVAAVGLVGTAGAFVALKLASPQVPEVASASVAAKPSSAPSPSVPIAIPSAAPVASEAVAAASSQPEHPAATPTPSPGTKVAPVQGKVVVAPKEPKEPKTVEKKPEAPTPAAAGGFSKEAAVAALSVAASQATVCKKPEGPWGTGKCQVVFAPSGRVTSANVMGAPFAGTPVGGCVSGVFRRARIPAFNGDSVTVSKSFTISP